MLIHCIRLQQSACTLERRVGGGHTDHRVTEKKKKNLHEASTPDVLSGGPSYWSGLYGPVSWLIFFQFEPHGLVRSVQREIFSGCPYMEIRPPGFLIRGWSQGMWFRPLLRG